jgi:hypothetical protein
MDDIPYMMKPNRQDAYLIDQGATTNRKLTKALTAVTALQRGTHSAAISVANCNALIYFLSKPCVRASAPDEQRYAHNFPNQ